MSEEFLEHGGCLCGSVAYTVTAKPFASDYCHCRMCQRITGAPVSAWMDFENSQVQWQSTDHLRVYQSSPEIERGFCELCGSTLTYGSSKHSQYTTLAVVSLNNPELVQPTYHIYTDSQVSWLKLNDTCKRYPQGRT